MFRFPAMIPLISCLAGLHSVILSMLGVSHLLRQSVLTFRKLFIKRFLNGILRLVESKKRGGFLFILFSVLLDHPTTNGIWRTNQRLSMTLVLDGWPSMRFCCGVFVQKTLNGKSSLGPTRRYTLPETNIAFENRPSQIPTINFQVLC